MEKDLIEISRYYGENREAVIYRNMSDKEVVCLCSYEVHLFEGTKKLKPQYYYNHSIDTVEDHAEDFVTYNNG